jgi:hypothetical protein
VNVVSTDGVVPVELDPEGRSLAAQHVNAITYYRDTGDASRLAGFAGLQLGGYELETNPERIQALVIGQQLDFEDFYEQ